MKILVDVNLTPKWIKALDEKGFEAIHWSEVGELDAPDRHILDYAIENNFVVFTHDLDFGDILAVLLGTLVKALHQFESRLNEGALITIDLTKVRARILPIERD